MPTYVRATRELTHGCVLAILPVVLLCARKKTPPFAFWVRHREWDLGFFIVIFCCAPGRQRTDTSTRLRYVYTAFVCAVYCAGHLKDRTCPAMARSLLPPRSSNNAETSPELRCASRTITETPLLRLGGSRRSRRMETWLPQPNVQQRANLGAFGSRPSVGDGAGQSSNFQSSNGRDVAAFAPHPADHTPTTNYQLLPYATGKRTMVDISQLSAQYATYYRGHHTPS